MKIEPVVLEGAHVRLEPLAAGHVVALAAVAFDPALWRWMLSEVRTVVDLERYVAEALAARDAGHALPFTTVERAGGRAVGSTRFGSIEPAHRRVEIGWTWIAGPWQRSPINTEAKYLMLRHAFEVWGCNRVEFKTNALNERSRRALLRIGAREEGTLRRHMVGAGGIARDSVYFSVIAEEWPSVKARLDTMMRRA